jgi:phage terminase large subunit
MALEGDRLKLDIAPVFQPLVKPARYKGAYGGRGSGKSHFFADMMVWSHMRMPGMRSVCVREVLKSLKESAKLTIEDKIKAHGVGAYFEIQMDRIKSHGDGFIIFQGMQDHNAESIKSFEGFDRCWIEEAQTLTERSLTLLRPTIRKSGSEIWASWNPRRKTDAVDRFLRMGPPDNAVVVRANHRDNPWFPPELEAERRHDYRHYPERYEHIWEGE